MALNLHKAGATLVVHNRSPAAVEDLIGEGMHSAPDPAAVAAEVDVVITMLTDTPAVEQVLAGDRGVLAGIRQGALIIDMGTTSVPTTRDLAARAASRGVGYVDAPVSGGVVGAGAGTLAIMAGATEQDFTRALPLLKILGAAITHVGDVGAGQVAKAANQVIVGLTIGAVAEALSLARRAGVDPARVREAIAGGFAASRVLDAHGLRMIEGNFEPGARCTTQHKDMSQALALAAELGLTLPATALNRALYQKMMDAGFGELDHSALVKAIEGDAD